MESDARLAAEFRQELMRRAKLHYQQAYGRQMQGALEEAIDLYRHSLELFPTAEAHTFLGWAYSFRGSYDDAIAECQKAIALDPEFGNPHNDIGAYLIELGRAAEAVEHLQRALRSPRYDCCHYAHFNLGRIHEELGALDQARQHYAEALRIAPGYHLAYRALRQIERRVGTSGTGGSPSSP